MSVAVCKGSGQRAGKATQHGLNGRTSLGAERWLSSGEAGCKPKDGGTSSYSSPPKAQFPGVVPNMHIPRDAFSRAQLGRLSSEWTGCREEDRSQG